MASWGSGRRGVPARGAVIEGCGQGFTTQEAFELWVGSGCSSGTRAFGSSTSARRMSAKRNSCTRSLATLIAVTRPVSPSSQGGVPGRGWLVEASSVGESVDTVQGTVRHAREW